MNIIKNSMDRASLLYNGGLKEGLAKGEVRANLAITRKMKDKGLPLAEIADITGLPTETIERLYKKRCQSPLPSLILPAVELSLHLRGQYVKGADSHAVAVSQFAYRSRHYGLRP